MSEDDLIDSPKTAAKRPAQAPSLRTDAVRTEPVRKRKAGSKSEDHFHLPEDLLAQLEAKGLSAEFKRVTYFGKEEDPDYHIGLAENGWEPLSLSSFPLFKKMMPKSWTKDTFEKRGQILMVRPQHLTDEAKAEEKRMANSQVKGQLASLKSDTKAGEAARTLAKVNRSYEAGMPIE
jgi:hypothetical protein